MKNTFLTLLLFSLSSCASVGAGSGTGTGYIYTNHTEGVIATANQAGKKRGQACTSNILGLFTSGDASMGAAMKDGAITIVNSADRYYNSVMGVYGQMCLIVTGN